MESWFTAEVVKGGPQSSLEKAIVEATAGLGRGVGMIRTTRTEEVEELKGSVWQVCGQIEAN